jgi:hypothetical protein
LLRVTQLQNIAVRRRTLCLLSLPAAIVVLVVAALTPGVAVAGELAPAATLRSVLPRAERVGSVESAEALATTFGSAQRALDPQSAPVPAAAAVSGPPTIVPARSPAAAAPPAPTPSDTPVQIIVVHGHFVDTLAKMPRGAAPPSGSVMAFTVNASTGFVLETYVGNGAPTVRAEPLLRVRLAAHSARAAGVSEARRRPRARAATWGSRCSAGEAHHCYALAIWSMSGGERVEGTETEQYGIHANVPGWEKGNFVDGEEWAVFFNSPSGTLYWTEIGQAAGEYNGCCTWRWFYAYQNHSGYHESLPSERWNIQPETWAAYFMRASGNGVWCFDVGPNGEQQYRCVGGFETYATLLEDGAEIASETTPVEEGAVVANATWLNGTVHPWNYARDGLYNENGLVNYNGMCVAPFTPVNYPGNIYYGTYGSCP